jgi:hypothetical protein
VVRPAQNPFPDLAVSLYFDEDFPVKVNFSADHGKIVSIIHCENINLR